MAAEESRGERTELSTSPARQQTRVSAAEIRAQVVGLLAGIVRWVGLLFAAVLVVHIILYIGSANPDNGITTFVARWAGAVSLGFKNLFTPDDPKLQVLVNYGIAALFWLVVTAIVAKLLRRLG